MIASATPETQLFAPTAIVIAEVRFSLPQMLEELKLERTIGSFAMEKLDQKEIVKLFKARAPRRAKSKH